jgi:predicted nucleotidyltransferase
MFKIMNRYSKKTLELLAFLARRPLAKMYGREIAKSIKMSVGGTNQILRSLANAKMLNVEKRGRMLFYSVNMENPEVKQFKIFINVSELNPLIDKIKMHSDRIILYGSCADGTDTEKSDVDLFILTEKKDTVNAEIRRFKTDRKIKPVLADHSEFLKLKEKDKAFYEQVTAGKELWMRENELRI